MSGGFFLDWWTPIKNFPVLLQACGLSLLFMIIGFAFELVLGAVFGYIRYTKKGILYPVITVYVEIIRNTPLLVQLLLFYFGLPQLGISTTPFQTGAIGMICYGVAYGTEIYRGGIQSIDKGQWEAGKCLGLSKGRIFIDIIFPQTLRTIFPTLTNESVYMLYATSLLSAVSVEELMGKTKYIAGSTFRTLEMYVACLILYYLMASIIAFIMRKINLKYFPSVSSTGA